VAEELVVKEQLTADLISAGDELTRVLREDGNFALVCSFWLYTSATNRWRLDLSSPIVDAFGPLHAYKIIQDKLAPFLQMNEAIPLDSISVLSPDHIIVKSLQTLGHFEILDLPPGPTPRVRVPRRISLSRVGDVFIDDALIYFIR
jgi:hypothetical protein